MVSKLVRQPKPPRSRLLWEIWAAGGRRQTKGESPIHKIIFPLVPKRMACLNSHIVGGRRQRRHKAAFGVMHLGTGIIL